jgi:hypothetical protein
VSRVSKNTAKQEQRKTSFPPMLRASGDEREEEKKPSPHSPSKRKQIINNSPEDGLEERHDDLVW